MKHRIVIVDRAWKDVLGDTWNIVCRHKTQYFYLPFVTFIWCISTGSCWVSIFISSVIRLRKVSQSVFCPPTVRSVRALQLMANQANRSVLVSMSQSTIKFDDHWIRPMWYPQTHWWVKEWSVKLIISGVVKLLTSLDVFTSGSGLARSSGAATNETRETYGGRSPNGDILSRT